MQEKILKNETAAVPATDIAAVQAADIAAVQAADITAVPAAETREQKFDCAYKSLIYRIFQQ